MKSNLNALLIEPDVTKRVRLRQVLQAQGDYDSIIYALHPVEALKLLKDSANIDVVILGASISGDITKELIGEAKKLEEGQNAAFIQVMSQGQESVTAVALNLMNGIDGQLLEPYSVQGLQEITEIAIKLRHQRAMARAKQAITILVNEISSQLDTVAELKSIRAEGRLSMKLLQEMCQAVHPLDPELRLFFIEKVTETFAALPAPTKKIYAGPSNRLRAKSAAKNDSKIDLQAICKSLANIAA